MKKIALLLIISSLLIASQPADDFVAMLKQKLEEYVKSNPSDQAILIFNQEKYAQTDTAFFQAYLVNEDMVGVKGKKILALTIYDVSGKLIQKMNFSVVNGRANNQLAISPSTSPGVYLFAVSHAQNVDDESAILFTKEVLIIENRKVSVRNRKSSPTLSVSYESGFVNDLQNTLILQSNQTGTGKIKNSKNEDVAQFIVTKDKISTLSFTPQKGESYFAEIEAAGIKTPLLTANSDGCIIKMGELSNAPTRKITILSSLNISQKKRYYLIVTNRRKIAFSSPIVFDTKGQFEINLPKEAVKNGVSYVTVLDEKGIVLTERPFFRYEPSIIASLTPSTNDASTRQKISVELNAKDIFGNSVQGEFSAVVYETNLFPQNIISPFAEQVSLRYPIYTIVKNNLQEKELDEEKAKQIDYLLGGLRIIGIPWTSVVNFSPKAIKPISSSLKLKGKVFFKNSGKAVPDSTLVMGYLQNNMIGYVGHTSKDGRFELPFLYDFFGADQLFYILEQNGKELEEPFEIVPDEGKLTLRPLSNFTITDSIDSYGDYIQKKRIVENSYNFYGSKNAIRTEAEDLNTRFEEEAMGVDMSVNVQDYISFPTMEDLVREVIPFLQNKKKGNTPSVRLLINQNIKNTNYVTAKGEPLFIVDGVLTKNIQSFLSLKPVDILTIKIINDINKLNRLGPLGKNGVVLVKTKKPAVSSVTSNSTIINVQGLNKAKDYNNPSYQASNNTTIPDIRSSLYWNPLQNLSQEGKATIAFYTSDKIGSYIVLVRGISSTGESFEVSTKLNVSYQHP